MKTKERLSLIELSDVELRNISGGKERSYWYYISYGIGSIPRKLSEFAENFSDTMQDFAPVRY